MIKEAHTLAILSTHSGSKYLKRLSGNVHLPFDKLMALSKVEGLR